MFWGNLTRCFGSRLRYSKFALDGTLCNDCCIVQRIITQVMRSYFVDKLIKISVLLFVVALVLTPVATFAAEDAAADNAVVQSGVDLTPLYGIGCGLTLFGAALGISRIGAKSVESMARQPEAAGKINTAMIISAALIEGVTFFALIVCMLK